MKRILPLFAALPLLFLSACAPVEPRPSGPNDASDPIELSLWTYPVGGWGTLGTVSPLLAAFHRDHPDITVTMKTVDYTSGDSEVDAALAEGKGPDLIFEGPERLVAKWGANGQMEDLSDLWKREQAAEIAENVEVACGDGAGSYYIYPVCMTTHCMAINRDLFEEKGAWQYIHEDTHTWSTDEFVSAVNALHTGGVEKVAAVYCAGQGGDQGTRALVNNLYGGTYTDRAHTRYTVDSKENIDALELLYGLDGIVFDKTIAGAEEIAEFAAGELAMAFCWNVSQEITQTINGTLDFDVFPMAFPTNRETPALQGGIWGFGIFKQEDSARVEAAKTFIRYITEECYNQAVIASTYWPVRKIDGLYENDKLMSEYGIFSDYFDDYYQVTPGWAEARTAWWNMLQAVGDGTSPAEAVKQFSDSVNKA